MVKMTGALSTFKGISKESYYLNFNRDQIFINLLHTEGHFRYFIILKEDEKGFLNCCVKHLADAEGHCDEAISHALIAESEDSSRGFLELRDKIRELRRYIQSSPITRDEGIREIRKIRRSFEAFNPDYDVSKCETCGDPAEVMEDITKILSELKNNSYATAAHENDAEDFLIMEREMAENVIAKLSEKYGVEPPKLVISDKCHEPNVGLYAANQIMVCKTGINLHVLAHEFFHHVQAKKGMHMDEGEAEKFAVDLFAVPNQKGLYSNYNHSHNDMVKKIKDVGIIYGLQQLGFLADQGLKVADATWPEGLLGQPFQLWGDIVGTIGGFLGALYLPAPYDLVSAMVGGYLSTDLWLQAQRLWPMRIARPPPLVYTPPGTVTTPAVTAKGRYVMA